MYHLAGQIQPPLENVFSNRVVCVGERATPRHSSCPARTGDRPPQQGERHGNRHSVPPAQQFLARHSVLCRGGEVQPQRERTTVVGRRQLQYSQEVTNGEGTRSTNANW